MEELELNENDNKLLAYCYNRRRHLSDIARHIGIDVKNVSIRIEKLKKKGAIEISHSGNKKFIRTKEGNKITEYYTEILNELDARGGELKQSEFLSLIPFNFSKPEDHDKFSAPLQIMHIRPKLVDHYIKITEEGKKFLRENKK